MQEHDYISAEERLRVTRLRQWLPTNHVVLLDEFWRARVQRRVRQRLRPKDDRVEVRS